ncbi:MAG: hypothetical protein AAGG53_10150 [Cyanobacteria bacterium P01_H01_bin.152]
MAEIELLIGEVTANTFVGRLLVAQPDDAPAFPAVFILKVDANPVYGFVMWILYWALFYVVCFHWLPNSRTRQDSANR